MPIELSENSCDTNILPKKIKSVRKIPPTHQSVSGRFSFRDFESIPFESTLERDFIARHELDSSVLDIFSQPVEIPFVDNDGRTRRYTPDFLVHFYLGNRFPKDYRKPLLVEVKPQDQWRANWKIWKNKWKAARRYANEQGWRFCIYDESRIRDKTLQNTQWVERFKRTSFDDQDVDQVLKTVREMGCCSVDYLLARFFTGALKNQGLRLIWHLVATRRLMCDLSSELTETSELWEACYE